MRRCLRRGAAAQYASVPFAQPMALKSRIVKAQLSIADIDGDITALRAKLREVRDEAPPPASDSPAKG